MRGWRAMACWTSTLSSGVRAPQASGRHVCCGIRQSMQSIDYASSNPNFIALLADGDYAGGPQRSSYSTDGGRTWTPLPSMPFSAFAGNIAVSTPSNFIVGKQNAQPYYTLARRWRHLASGQFAWYLQLVEIHRTVLCVYTRYCSGSRAVEYLLTIVRRQGHF
jgi:hypothetical protein